LIESPIHVERIFIHSFIFQRYNINIRMYVFNWLYEKDHEVEID
jgi:hypothetical protein